MVTEMEPDIWLGYEPDERRGGRMTEGDVCERCQWRNKRAKRRGSGRNSAKR